MPTETFHPDAAKPQAIAKDKAKKPAQLPPFHVVLLDDNDHSHEYVMEMLKAIFGYAESIGFKLADKVDRRGLAVVFTTHRELAELKCEQIKAYGQDWRVATCRGSMSAIIVAAEG
ncbi:MAG TPA: ATP-dependent Clp protease adaptor ClpS [Tepidisphaeraceae bacterium]